MPRFDNAYVLDVMSDDHPGIVAAVTNAVEDWAATSIPVAGTVLGGYFTLIMIVSLPEAIEAELAARVPRRRVSSTAIRWWLAGQCLTPRARPAGKRTVS